MDNVLGSNKESSKGNDWREEYSTVHPQDIPDLYHLNPSEGKDSQLLCNNVADIYLIPSHSEVRKGEVQILTRSQTLNISRKFKNENSALFRKLYVLLLNLMFDVFLFTINEDGILHMIGNLLHFLPSNRSCKSEGCNKLRQLSSPITKSSQLNKFFRSLSLSPRR